MLNFKGSYANAVQMAYLAAHANLAEAGSAELAILRQSGDYVQASIRPFKGRVRHISVKRPNGSRETIRIEA